MQDMQMLTEQVKELQTKSQPLAQEIMDAQVLSEPTLRDGTRLVPLMSLMTTQEQQYVRSHIGMVAVEIDGQIHFVQQNTYVPPTPRTQIQRDTAGMPTGFPAVGGG